jgi:deazaflavin-dependent oxidoreductase (nitroreductase family)
MDRKYIVALLVIAIPLLAVVGWFSIPNSVFYKERRPTRLGKATNRVMSWFATIGLPLQVTLELPGRRTGKPVSTVLVPVSVGGEEYLVSMLGEQSEWVQNLRASAGKAAIRHGGKRTVVLEDVPVEERPPILKRYLKRAPGGRPHFPIGPDADEAEFAQLADRYPVFRIRPAAAGAPVTPVQRPAGAVRP